MSLKGALLLQPLRGFPLVQKGDDIVDLIHAALQTTGVSLEQNDIIVIAQKVISKAEGRSVDLNDIVPSARAIELSAAAEKDPRLIELILSESNEVLRVRPGVIIVEHRSGLVMANAGIDRSNVSGNQALLLPLDPDGSSSRIRDGLSKRAGVHIGVMIIDSIGRAWRNGTIGTVIGASVVPTLLDLRGQPDLFGRPLETTEVGWADELAAAASLTMGQASEGRPAVLVRGVEISGAGTARDMLRPKEKDLFR
ncbi:coenzyme F420-0:L-glutamate ligase/coenzyme F420-1:gamma-L-glutamate ligase [Afipia massiliensis]|uniref:Coenzyme F420-0:L-glutamate ligase/coenzyme F420-1:gamma-L-glutamate ligase n=1 Tax=Afipia massiliensis TaxID=211460 RepID=A0A840N8Q8_9BRAD|nr:coenzyme F420-0:L-glutamate ligase [Afipia massiliensis]MBB5055202.1 coenzyme F420-0:L-glutamate ligase/coenzyme F420-1:gamma-L-glutamate ligase [Afipia massiliensis]